MSRSLFLVLCSLLAVLSFPVSAAEGKKPNVLFIAIDDLNHWVGHLGRNAQTRTPNIDRLAAEGLSFTSAYCTAPACNPSRASLMSGQRPSTTGCYTNAQNWRPGITEDKLMNSHFFRNGYRVYGAGKIYHGAGDRGGDWTDYFDGKGGNLQIHPSAKNDGVGGIKFYPLASTNEEMPDHGVVDWCIERMNEGGEQPYFIACGLVKPHMPFSVPKEWFDQFPLESIELPPHREDDLDDIPRAGVKMAGPDGDHAAILKAGRWKEAVQAYLATIAYCDYEIGRLLDALDASPKKDNTLVCLWSDHGWSLGEKSHWRKFALWEEPTRTVHIWKVPGLTPFGKRCDWPVDYLNIYPTLCSLTGLPRPGHVEGFDMTPILGDPAADWDQPAMTTHGRGNHSVRFGDWRYIRYADGGEELYDHASDPLEYTNLAGDPKLAETMADLASHLPKNEAKDLPGGNGNGKAGGEGKGKGKGKNKKKGEE
ncbi:MAG: sulfatase [Verrucomicrobiae bacterium]|nr:sulfatase [Verrucomicrobiae bacterium]